jgi:hypothetical protein
MDNTHLIGTLMEGMDVPSYKRDLTNPVVLWLLGKLRDRNAKHTNYVQVMLLLLDTASARLLIKGRGLRDVQAHITSVSDGSYFGPKHTAALVRKPVQMTEYQREIVEKIAAMPATIVYPVEASRPLAATWADVKAKLGDVQPRFTVRKPGVYESNPQVLSNSSPGIFPERAPLIVKRAAVMNPVLGAPYGKQGTTTGRQPSNAPAQSNVPKPYFNKSMSESALGDGTTLRAPQLRRQHPDVQVTRDGRRPVKDKP